MDDKQRRRLRVLMTDKKRELLSSVHKSMAGRIGEDIRFAFEAAQDIPDQSVDDLCRHIDAALTEKRSEDIDAIDAALRRLEDGTYGICSECGDVIPDRRVQALPFALCCVDCQRILERNPAARSGPGHAGAPPESDYLSDKE